MKQVYVLYCKQGQGFKILKNYYYIKCLFFFAYHDRLHVNIYFYILTKYGLCIRVVGFDNHSDFFCIQFTYE